MSLCWPRLAALAVVVATFATTPRLRAQSVATPNAELLAEIEALHGALPKVRLAAADLQRLQALAGQLPLQRAPELQPALDSLLASLARRLPAPGAVEPFVAAYERLARHPGVGSWEAGSLWCQLGEQEVRVGNLDGAVGRFLQAVQTEPRLQFHVAQRLCRCEGGRQNYRAARIQLERARASSSGDLLDRMRIAQLEAFLRMREGLFESAGRALELSRRLAAELVAADQPLTPYDERQQLLLEMDYALFQQNHGRVIAKADALVADPDVTPMVRERAEVAKETARVLLGGEPDLALLQRLLADVVPANRDVVGALLVEQALHQGDLGLATHVAAELWRDRPLAGLSPEALVALGSLELQPATLPDPTGERWREWQQALQATWQRFLVEWRELAPDAEGIAFLQMAVRRNVLGLVVRLHMAAGGEAAAREAARLYLEVDALGSQARRLGIGTATIEDVRRDLLPADGALLVCVPSPIASFALWVTATELHVELLPPEGALRQRVLALRQLAFAPERSAPVASIRALADQLAGDLLPPPLRQRLGRAGTLVVAGRDLLHGLPIELVPSGSGWLGLERAIVYLPSVAIGRHLVRRPAAAPAGLDARVLAATELGAADRARWHLAPVEASATELAAAVAAIAPHRTEVVPAAGIDALRHPRIRCALLAVFAHGIFDGELACPAGLLLGPDRTGGSGALFEPGLPSAGLPQLLFLGVCGAARGPLRLGEDGGNRLAAAFLVAGCDLVISGDVDVRLDEALVLCGEFTAHLTQEQDPAAALLSARRRLAAVTPHPGAWAALRLEGAPTARVVLLRSGGNWWGWWVGGGLLAVVLVGLRRWRRTPTRPKRR